MAKPHNDDIDENYVIATPDKKPKSGGAGRSFLKRKDAAEDSAAEKSTSEATETDDAPKTSQAEKGTATSETVADAASDGQEAAFEASKKPRGVRSRVKAASRKKLITCGVVIVVVLGAAGVGFWTWHETPSFCGAICHSPMDSYLPTYYSEPEQQSTDKWGNTVSDSSSMLSATHREYADATCMSCHVPAITEQVTEGLEWVAGNYYYPLNERDLSRLVYYRGTGETEFCLNSSCHNMSKDDLTEATSESTRNPHSWHHSEYDCSDCHKAHRASVMVCSQCHDDYTLPDGWITYQESKELETTYGQYSDLEGESSK